MLNRKSLLGLLLLVMAAAGLWIIFKLSSNVGRTIEVRGIVQAIRPEIGYVELAVLSRERVLFFDYYECLASVEEVQRLQRTPYGSFPALSVGREIIARGTVRKEYRKVVILEAHPVIVLGSCRIRIP